MSIFKMWTEWRRLNRNYRCLQRLHRKDIIAQCLRICTLKYKILHKITASVFSLLTFPALSGSRWEDIWGVLWLKHVARAETSNYMQQCLWDVITCPCPWYLFLAQHSSFHLIATVNSNTVTYFHSVKICTRNSKFKHRLCNLFLDQ